MTRLPVRAYTDQLSYEPGDAVGVHVDAESDVHIRLVRLVSAHDGGAGLDEEIEWDAAGTFEARPQTTAVGSFMTGELADGVGPLSNPTLGAWVWSSDFGAARSQCLIDLAGVASLCLTDGVPGLFDSRGELIVESERLIDNEWHLVVAGSDAEWTHMATVPGDPVRGVRSHAKVAAVKSEPTCAPVVTVGAAHGREVVEYESVARGRGEDHFNGKIEAPFVARGPWPGADYLTAIAHGQSPVTGLDLVAAWDYSYDGSGPISRAEPCVPKQPAGIMVNGPARGVTSSAWKGKKLSFVDAPAEYAAVHFHATDLVDAGWDCVLHAALPERLHSGVYGVVVENSEGQDVVPIVVVPRQNDLRERVLFVLPTFTYLAYANENLFNGLDPSAMTDAEVKVEPEDQAHVGDSSFGLSMYDKHPDGSGVMYSSARRQIVNMRRGYRMWLVNAGRAFSSDMYLVEWLARRGIDADFVTDHELHSRGLEYFEAYSVIISGSHPEYTSEEMLDTLIAYRNGGGSFMYLGGNGWYWVTGVLSSDPYVVEIRRGHAGIRCWESLPGELTLVSTGEPGGLWRHRGRAPQVLSGLGFAAQGWGRSEPYYRSDEASSPEFAWVFDGVTEDPIGAYGEVMGGAAGDEIDRVDQSLGTPHHAAVLASSRGHSNFYQRVLEEIAMNLPGHGGGEEDPEVHADMVYFATPAGGEVFSTGSIAWSGSLLSNGTDNGVSRITENVIRRFVARRSPQPPAVQVDE